MRRDSGEAAHYRPLSQWTSDVRAAGTAGRSRRETKTPDPRWPRHVHGYSRRGLEQHGQATRPRDRRPRGEAASGAIPGGKYRIHLNVALAQFWARIGVPKCTAWRSRGRLPPLPRPGVAYRVGHARKRKTPNLPRNRQVRGASTAMVRSSYCTLPRRRVRRKCLRLRRSPLGAIPQTGLGGRRPVPAPARGVTFLVLLRTVRPARLRIQRAWQGRSFLVRCRCRRQSGARWRALSRVAEDSSPC
jgi:hypothetical protein